MTLKNLIIPIVTIAAFGSLRAETSDPPASPGSAYEHDGHRWHHHGAGLWKKLDLTETQKNDIRQYRENNKAAFRSALAGYLSAKQALLETIKNNETTQPAAATLAAAEANLMALRVKQEQYIASLLTGDQVTTWQNLQNKRATRLQDRITKLTKPSS